MWRTARYSGGLMPLADHPNSREDSHMKFRLSACSVVLSVGLLTGCSIQDATQPQIESLQPATERRIYGLILAKPRTLADLEQATRGHAARIYSIQFKVGEVSGSIGNAEPVPTAEAFTTLRDMMKADASSEFEGDAELLARLSALTFEEFKASAADQNAARGLVDRVQAHENLYDAALNKRASVVGLSVEATPDELTGLVQQLGFPVTVELEHGQNSMILRPHSGDATNLRASASLGTRGLYGQLRSYAQSRLSVSKGTVNMMPPLLAAATGPSAHPNRGRLTYMSPWEWQIGGVTTKVDRVFVSAHWDKPGNWPSWNSGIEVDFNAWPSRSRGVRLYGTCYSSTNLPAGYDDCPTAGVSESTAAYGFGFGSYEGRRILPGYPYWGAIYLKGPLIGIPIGHTFDFNLTSGRTKVYFCSSSYNIWCRKVDEARILISQSSPDLKTGWSENRSW